MEGRGGPLRGDVDPGGSVHESGEGRRAGPLRRRGVGCPAEPADDVDEPVASGGRPRQPRGGRPGVQRDAGRSVGHSECGGCGRHEPCWTSAGARGSRVTGVHRVHGRRRRGDGASRARSRGRRGGRGGGERRSARDAIRTTKYSSFVARGDDTSVAPILFGLDHRQEWGMGWPLLVKLIPAELKFYRGDGCVSHAASGILSSS